MFVSLSVTHTYSTGLNQWFLTDWLQVCSDRFVKEQGKISAKFINKVFDHE